MSGEVTIQVWEGFDGRPSVNIGDDNNGYRIAGPEAKLGVGKLLVKSEPLRMRDIENIRVYLNQQARLLRAKND